MAVFHRLPPEDTKVTCQRSGGSARRSQMAQPPTALCLRSPGKRLALSDTKMPMIALLVDISTNCRGGIMPFRDILDSESDFSAVGTPLNALGGRRRKTDGLGRPPRGRSRTLLKVCRARWNGSSPGRRCRHVATAYRRRRVRIVARPKPSSAMVAGSGTAMLPAVGPSPAPEL